MRTFCGASATQLFFKYLSSPSRWLMCGRQGCASRLCWMGTSFGTSSPVHQLYWSLFWCWDSWFCTLRKWQKRTNHLILSGRSEHLDKVGPGDMSTLVSYESLLIFFLFLSKAAQCASAKNHGTDTHRNIHITIYKCPYTLNIKILLFAAAYCNHSLPLRLIFR